MTSQILSGAKLHRRLELATALLRGSDDLLRLCTRLLERELGFSPRLLRHRFDEAIQGLTRVTCLLQLALEDRELFDQHPLAELNPTDAREQLQQLVLVTLLRVAGAREL